MAWGTSLASQGARRGDGTRWEWERGILCTLDLAPNTGKLAHEVLLRIVSFIISTA